MCIRDRLVSVPGASETGLEGRSARLFRRGGKALPPRVRRVSRGISAVGWKVRKTHLGLSGTPAEGSFPERALSNETPDNGADMESGTRGRDPKPSERTRGQDMPARTPVSYTHLRAHENPEQLVCRLLLEKKKYKPYQFIIPIYTPHRPFRL